MGDDYDKTKTVYKAKVRSSIDLSRDVIFFLAPR